MNLGAIAGLYRSRKAWSGAGIVAMGEQLVERGLLDPRWYWAGLCVVAVGYMASQAYEDRVAVRRPSAGGE